MELLALGLAYFVLGALMCALWSVFIFYMPGLRIKNVELFPSIRIHIRSRVWHFHHKFYFSIILIVSFFVDWSLFQAFPIRAFLAGGVLKELIFPPRIDRYPRKLSYKSTEKNTLLLEKEAKIYNKTSLRGLLGRMFFRSK